MYRQQNQLSYPQPMPTIVLKDYGNQPFVVDINEASKQNEPFRTVLWTGEKLQVTVMSIAPGEDIGLEVHPETDQFLRIEEGVGLVQMGPTEHEVNFQEWVEDDSAIFVPVGTWHNLINTGNVPLKLYAIYAPAEHLFGTIHQTKTDDLLSEMEMK